MKWPAACASARVSLRSVNEPRPEPQAEEPAMQKRIWIGLDVHAENIEVCRLDGDSNVVQRSSLENAPKVIEKRFKQWMSEGKVVCAYEAGGCGFEIYRH